MMKKVTKKEMSWILYDCGNSAYSMAITTALFPGYYLMISGGKGMALGPVNSFASLIVALLSPVLGTIADYKDFKKRFFTFFALLGIIMTGLIAAVPDSQAMVLVGVYIMTAIGFAGANVFYDAFLVDVSENENMDRVSTMGFAYGYIASIVPFGIALGVIWVLGMKELIGYQIGFVITALWWGLFTIPLFRHVKQVHYVEREPQPIRNSFKRLGRTFLEIKKHRTAFVFLIGYFFYIDGVGTIIKMCVPYATETLNLDSSNIFLLLGILLIIQVVAFPCALLYGYFSNKFSAKKMILFAIGTYIFATCFATVMTQLWHIFILGALIGSAQGGIQALSRSYFAKIIPKNNANEFFGFYNIFGKFAAILGPSLMYGASVAFKSTRWSIMIIIPLFIIGFVIMLKLPDYEVVDEGI